MIYQNILESKKQNRKQFAILVDPDKCSTAQLKRQADMATEHRADYFFVGSSLLTQDNFQNCINILKEYSNVPVVLFPGNMLQISAQADAMLLLSLISGRNPDLLIGHHVMAAAMIQKSNIETIATGYMLIDPGHPTSVSYMSHTLPIPYDKPDIAYCTALAGAMLGLKMIYMDAGSGARFPLSEAMIKAVRNAVDLPIIAGGGIKTCDKAVELCKAGADLIVVGNAIEKDAELISEMAMAIHNFQPTSL